VPTANGRFVKLCSSKGGGVAPHEGTTLTEERGSEHAESDAVPNGAFSEALAFFVDEMVLVAAFAMRFLFLLIDAAGLSEIASMTTCEVVGKG